MIVASGSSHWWARSGFPGGPIFVGLPALFLWDPSACVPALREEGRWVEGDWALRSSGAAGPLVEYDEHEASKVAAIAIASHRTQPLVCRVRICLS